MKVQDGRDHYCIDNKRTVMLVCGGRRPREPSQQAESEHVSASRGSKMFRAELTLAFPPTISRCWRCRTGRSVRPARNFREVRDGNSAGANRGGTFSCPGKRESRPATAAIHAAEIRKVHRAVVSQSEIARQFQINRSSVGRIVALVPPKTPLHTTRFGPSVIDPSCIRRTSNEWRRWSIYQ